MTPTATVSHSDNLVFLVVQKEGDETSHDGASYFENIFKTLYETEVNCIPRQ